MKKKMYYALGGILVLIALITLLLYPSPKMRSELLLADKLMPNRPDSALHILQKLESKSLSRENRALFALLMTQAKFKMREPDNSDSLINIAFEYYKQSDDPLRKAQTYFYKGRIDELMGNQKEALLNYQQASEIANTAKDNDLLSLIYNKWGLFLRKQSLNDDALEKQKQALHYSTLIKDTTTQIYVLNDLGNIYYLKKDYKSALNCFSKALKLAQIIKIKDCISATYNNLAVLYKNIGKYNMAMVYVNLSIPLAMDKFKYAGFSTKCDLFISLNQYDSARYYLNKSLKNDDLISKATYYYFMGELESKVGNFKEAYKSCKQYLIFASDIEKKQRKNEIVELQKRYDYSIFKNKNASLELEKKSRDIWLLSILIALLATIWFSTFFYKRMRRQKDKIIDEGRKQLRGIEQILQGRQKEFEKLMKIHEDKINRMADWVLTENKVMQKIKDVNDLRGRSRTSDEDWKRLSEDELETLRKVIDLTCDNFTLRLKQTFPKLSEENMLICCLIKLKVPVDIMGILLGITDDTLTKRIYRLKKKQIILPDNCANLDEFLVKF